MTDNIANAERYLSTDELRDGRKVSIRAIRPEDKPILQESWHHLSRQSQYFRFFAEKDELTEQELEFFTDIDFVHHVGLLASIINGDAEVPAGVGRYITADVDTSSRSAELAFVVVEEFQGLGIATILLKHLTQIARAEGIAEFTAFVLPENRRMQTVLRKSGLSMNQVVNSVGVLEISLSLK